MFDNYLSAKTLWIGRVCSALVVLVLFGDASVHLFRPELVAGDMVASGFSATQTPTVGLLVFLCALLYAFPRTAMLGAIVLTGFLGGAICTHFRMGEVNSAPAIICIVLGVLAWIGLFLRDERVRMLLPLRVSKL